MRLTRSAALRSCSSTATPTTILRCVGISSRLARMSTTPSLSKEEMDQAIREMNDEMESLFGSPSGDAQPSMHNIHEPPVQDIVAPRPPSPSTPPREPLRTSCNEEFVSAKDALIGRIGSCASELQSTTAGDVEGATRLAACIGECARAVAALDRL